MHKGAEAEGELICVLNICTIELMLSLELTVLTRSEIVTVRKDPELLLKATNLRCKNRQ